MQYKNFKKEKLPDDDTEVIIEKRADVISKTQMVVILIITSSIFLVLLMLELSMIFRYNASEKTEEMKKFNKTLIEDLPTSLVANLSKYDRLNELVVVYHYKNYSTVRSKICTGLSSNRKFSACSEITSTKQGYHVFVPPKSEVLGNKKVVLSLVWKKITAPKEIADGSVTLFILDLNDIYNKPVITPGPYDNQTLLTYNPFEIIPFENKFEIFVKSTEYCSPPGSLCLIRYSDKGEWLGTFDFKFETKNKVFNLEKIYSLKKYDPRSGYVYISLQNSIVKLLNQYLEVSEERIFNGIITSHSVLNGNIVICSVINRLNPYTKCFKLNSRLEIQENYVLRNHLDKYDWKILNLMNGDSLAVSISKKSPLSVEINHLTSGGKISKPHVFALPKCDYHLNPFEKFDEMPGYYCFSFTCIHKSATYCVDSFEAVNLTSYHI